MTQGTGSLTPFTAGTESRVITFDFGSIWKYSNPLLIIEGLVSITCAIAPASVAQDYLPSARILGLPEITSSPSTKAGDQAVAQTFGNLVPGVTYIITCTVLASDNSQAVLWNYINSDQNF